MIYLRMWAHVRLLNKVETGHTLALLGPAHGIAVSIGGVPCVDVDLIEALTNWENDAP